MFIQAQRIYRLFRVPKNVTFRYTNRWCCQVPDINFLKMVTIGFMCEIDVKLGDKYPLLFKLKHIS